MDTHPTSQEVFIAVTAAYYALHKKLLAVPERKANYPKVKSEFLLTSTIDYFKDIDKLLSAKQMNEILEFSSLILLSDGNFYDILKNFQETGNNAPDEVFFERYHAIKNEFINRNVDFEP